LTGSFASVADQTNTYALNQRTMFQSITKCTTKTFKVRKSEYLPSAQYFVRVKNQDFNYTNNPTFIANGTTDSLNGTVLARGSIKISDFVNNPTTYITTVGLYDSDNELVAVAKLSQPTQKTFDSELLIRVRLDF
jgi:flagellar basal body P-ring protein FlgI